MSQIFCNRQLLGKTLSGKYITRRCGGDCAKMYYILTCSFYDHFLMAGALIQIIIIL